MSACAAPVHHAPRVQSATEARPRQQARPRWAYSTGSRRPEKSGGSGKGVSGPANSEMDTLARLAPVAVTASRLMACKQLAYDGTAIQWVRDGYSSRSRDQQRASVRRHVKLGTCPFKSLKLVRQYKKQALSEVKWKGTQGKVLVRQSFQRQLERGYRAGSSGPGPRTPPRRRTTADSPCAVRAQPRSHESRRPHFVVPRTWMLMPMFSYLAKNETINTVP